MPSCFALTKKGASEPAKLQQVDDEMRLAFGGPPNEVEWFRGWYDLVGLGLAMGKDWGQLRVIFEGTDLVPVVDWLEANYTVESWYERK